MSLKNIIKNFGKKSEKEANSSGLTSWETQQENNGEDGEQEALSFKPHERLSELDELSRNHDGEYNQSDMEVEFDLNPVTDKLTSKKPFASFMKKNDAKPFDSLSALNEEEQNASSNYARNEKEQEEEIFADQEPIFNNLDEKTTHTATDMFGENIYATQQRKIPVIGSLSINKQYKLVGVVAALSLVGIISGGLLYGNASSQQAKTIQSTTQFSSDIQKINDLFAKVIAGSPEAYKNLQNVAQKANIDFKSIENSLSSQDSLGNVKNEMITNLARVNKNIEILHEQSALVKNSSQRVTEISQSIDSMNTSLDQLLAAYLPSGNTAQITEVYALKSSLQNIKSNATVILLSDNVSTQDINNLARERENFKNLMIELNNGNAAKGVTSIAANLVPLYNQVATSWIKFTDNIDPLINHGNELLGIKDLSPKTSQIIASLNRNISEILDNYESHDLNGVQSAKILLSISFILLLISLVLTFYIYSFEKDNRSILETIENNKNRTSILRLLNELMPLQDGDLTKKTTLTEEITGAIADQINATIDSLASLVRKIKDTSLVMREKTHKVNIIASEMLSSNEDQANALNNTGLSVINISQAITHIATQTEKSSSQAENSVRVSEQGAEQVLASIHSMQEINNNMNETGTLMKKVSDSSRQISEIVELLSDITEETSILALNATVQAAKAGEAGKGFKIVADSIQELADTAGENARRVGALIAAVQTDIQAMSEAVYKTTEEVQNGVNLSERAGESLNKMTEVSNELSLIVREISQEAKKHAVSAHQVSENMKVILNSTEANKKATQQTVMSIGDISKKFNELGESVQSFKVD